ncbi:ABC-three component system protein [Pseudanabaena sp. BC1403]|uniref:ABC-three component system protein n=1 Tax=Pseudanabaena sp. BC1403 TaxID=2043171 RepID=UPI000CD89530|nr:ABC-three component system protein [Pseudanabaena sp. BC1403]
MSCEDKNLRVHEMIFRLKCLEKKGSEFQSFFEKIMFKLDTSFISIKPSGKEGDWKCDGFSKKTGTVYQCYAPENLQKSTTVAKAVLKVKEDFQGAKEHWAEEMKCWIFVWSAHSQLPPQVLKTLSKIKNENTEIIIDDWSQESLWVRISKLSTIERESILDFSLEVKSASETTAAEVESLLSYLTRQKVEPIGADLELTELQEKLDKNNLSGSIQVLVKNAIPITKIVEDYTKNHYDIEYSGIVAKVLSDKYCTLTKEDIKEADAIFFSLIEFVSSKKMNEPKLFWASIGIVSHYFQLCDIFER